jgi:quinol monooxygenase YgiN
MQNKILYPTILLSMLCFACRGPSASGVSACKDVGANASAGTPSPAGNPTINLAALPPDAERQFVNLVSVNIKRELLDEFLGELLPYAAASRAEPGVVRYDIHQSPHDPTVIELYEVYKNTAARNDHNKSAHRNAFFAKVTERGYFRVPAVSKTVYLLAPKP